MKVEEWLKEREDKARREAIQKAKQEDIFLLLEEYGAIPDHVREAVLAQWRPEMLKKWLKLAAKAGSMEQFEKEMQSKENAKK